MITIEDLLRAWDDALADSLGFPYATVQRILTKAAIVQASGDCRKRGAGVEALH